MRNIIGRIKRAFRRRKSRGSITTDLHLTMLEEDVIEAAKRWSAADYALTQGPYRVLVRREYNDASYGLHAAVDRLDARTSQIG